MPSIKISELPVLTQLSANNANTVFVAVDKTTNTTSQFSTTTLASALFANNVLNVGTQNPSNFPGLIAQFIANTAPYGQVNFENANTQGSMDIVLTADIGDDSNNFVDLGIQNSQHVDALYSAIGPADGYLTVQGSSASQFTGNLVIGTSATKANVLFSLAGFEAANVVAKITTSGLNLMSGRSIIFADDSVQSVAASPAAVTLAAQANTIITQGVDTTQNTNITTANNHAWAAFAKANTALQNTSGTFAGNLTITGNVLTQGTISLNNSTFATDTAFVKITASDGFATVPPSNTNYMLHITGKANSVTRVILDSFGVGANGYPLLSGRHGRGSAALPAATGNNDVLLRFAGNGYTGTQFPTSSPSKIDMVATENFSDTNRGTRIEFWNTPTGSNTIQKIALFNADTVEFTGTVQPDKGFIYVPTIYQGAQTAITINFSITSLIRATLTADLTFTLSNFVYGKVVEVWLTNTGGLARTVTHGCSATNSTENSTTFTIPATSSAYLRYFSIAGDLANTFVTVQHA